MLKKIWIIFFILLFFQYQSATAEPQQVSTDAKLEYNKGIDYYNSGQFDNAINAFRQAIELEPNYIDAYYNLAATFDYLRQYEASISMYNELIKRKPDDYGAILSAAKVSYKMGNTEKTKHFLSLLPSSSPYYYQAEQLAQALGTNMTSLKALNVAEKKTIVENKTVELPDATPPDADIEIHPIKSEQPLTDNTKQIEPQIVSQAKNEQSPKFAGNFYYEDIPSPTGIVTDNVGYLYVADYSDNVIFKITPTGEKMVYLKHPKISGPIGLAMDDGGNLYIANYDGNNVLKLSSSHQLTTLIENIEKPYYLYVSGGCLFVSSQGINGVLRYKLH